MDQPNFPKLEEETLAFWEKEKIFEQTLEKSKGGKPFVFFEGPPTANGKPGIHHIEARAFKDLIPRYKTMQGFFVERKAGWDTHGLPVEIEVEKRLKISGKKQIEEYGIAKFNEECKRSVWKYKEEWEQMTKRIGFWLDLDKPYVTYEPEYVESLWWVMKQIWDKGFLYQGHKVVPHCPRCETALSSHEVAQGYEKVKENSVYVKFEVTSEKLIGNSEGKVFILAWTTTPWTLPGNVALAVHKELTYVFAKQGEETYIVAEPRLEVLQGDFEIVKKAKGSELVGVEYEPLFPFLDLAKESGKKAYYIADADFVTVDEGTGVVHTAVMYGEDDYALGERLGLPKVHTVDTSGHFNELVKPWAGKFVKDTVVEREIVDFLKKEGKLYREEPYEHEYPFCWRCHAPLLYYAKDSWFVAMSRLRKELKKNNAEINWVPAHIKEGRFGEWLNEVKDWAFSRERYWGTPLPIWRCSECKHTVCIGSFAELRENAGKVPEPFDPHRPFVDDIAWPCKECDKGEMRRVPEVADVWFDSGCMPYAQAHYMGSGELKNFPADFISEAIDQTRGWFYTLLAVSTLLDKGAPYRNVICLGHVLDANGKKMSKSIGNVVDPHKIIEKYGADAVRWFMYTVNQPGDAKNFDEKVLSDITKKHFLILWNVLTYYETYAAPLVSNEQEKPAHVLDRWILALLSKTAETMTFSLDQYDVTGAARALDDFISDLSTWYVRRSRERFKAGGDDARAAAATLRTVLRTVAALSAPFTPFFAEALFQHVGEKQSVHLAAWPEAKTFSSDARLLEEMTQLRKVVELGHALRSKAGVKVRQPLSQFVIAGATFQPEVLRLLQDEMNVLEVHESQTAPTGSEWLSTGAGAITVALDTTLTDELKEMGAVRDIIRTANALRRKGGYVPGDSVALHFQTPNDFLDSLVEGRGGEIRRGARASTLTRASELPEIRETIMINGQELTLAIAPK